MANTLKSNRNILTMAVQGVRTSLQQFVQNRTTQNLMADAAETVARLSKNRIDGFNFASEAWHATEPTRTFTYQKQVPATPVLDGNGQPVLNAQGNPTITPAHTLTETETLTYDVGKRFVFEDTSILGQVVYFHQGNDSPTIRDLISIEHGFMSYAHYNGEMPTANIQALLGQNELPTPNISAALDAWA